MKTLAHQWGAGSRSVQHGPPRYQCIGSPCRLRRGRGRGAMPGEQGVSGQQQAMQPGPSGSVPSAIHRRAGSPHSGSLPGAGPGCPGRPPTAPHKQGRGLNLPQQWWPWAPFGFSSLASDLLPWVSFGPLPLGATSRHARCGAMFPPPSFQHPRPPWSRIARRVPQAPIAPSPLCPARPALCTAPLPGGRRSHILPTWPSRATP